MAQDIEQRLTRERPRKGAMTEFDFGNVQYALLGATPFVIIFGQFLILWVTMVNPHLEYLLDIAPGILLYCFAGISLGGFGLGFIFDWYKAHVAMEKTPCKVNMRWMEANSRNVRLTEQRTLLVKSHDGIDARAPIKSIVDTIAGVLEVDIDKDEAFKGLMAKIIEKLPKIPDDEHNRSYIPVRWRFPDTPFPDPQQNGKEWEPGDKGQPLNHSLIVLVHPDYALPKEAFDRCEETTTLWAHYESETPARLGDLDVWEFYEPLGEWIATPGLLPQYRRVMAQVLPDDNVRDYTQVTELLRAEQERAGSDMRVDRVVGALQRLVSDKSWSISMEEGAEYASGSYERRTTQETLAKYWWVVIIVTILSVLVYYFWGMAAGIFPKWQIIPGVIWHGI